MAGSSAWVLDLEPSQPQRLTGAAPGTDLTLYLDHGSDGQFWPKHVGPSCAFSVSMIFISSI